MVTKRIIGSILVENGMVVRRVSKKTQSIISTIDTTLEFLQEWGIDELFIINVGPKIDMIPILDTALTKCQIPVTIGGGINCLSHVESLIKNGADKVVIGRGATRELCSEVANKFGAQAIVVSIDDDHLEAHKDVDTWDIGEIIMHDISRDGLGAGLNLDILPKDSRHSIIAMGGAGNYGHIVDGLALCDGVSVGNLFHFSEISCRLAKKVATDMGFKIRC